MCFFVLFLLLFIPDPSPTHLFLLLFLLFSGLGGGVHLSTGICFVFDCRSCVGWPVWVWFPVCAQHGLVTPPSWEVWATSCSGRSTRSGNRNIVCLACSTGTQSRSELLLHTVLVLLQSVAHVDYHQSEAWQTFSASTHLLELHCMSFMLCCCTYLYTIALCAGRF